MELERDIINFFSEDITKVSPEFHKDVRLRNSSLVRKLAEAVDSLGQKSAAAQGLGSAVTTYSKLKTSNHTLYVLTGGDSPRVFIGILKVGRKKLFVMNTRATQVEVNPLCLLDFYVHESHQRSGCGKRLYEAMLESEGVKPHQLAIDRPSQKCLNFMRKHYNLHPCHWQANSFVVYDAFFNETGTANAGQQSSRLVSCGQQYHSLSGKVEHQQPPAIRNPPQMTMTRQSFPPNFNWTPEHVLSQAQQSSHNSAPYLTMRGSTCRRGNGHGIPNSFGYSRYAGVSSNSTYTTSSQPRLPKPSLPEHGTISQLERGMNSRRYSSHKSFYY